MGGWRGRGESLRVRPLSLGGLARGARLIVRDTPEAALALALDALRQERFDVGDDRIARALCDRGSEWIAQDVRVGHPNPSWNTGFMDAMLSDTVLTVIPGLWRRVTPTLVVASARPHEQGAELVVFSHVTVRGWTSSNDAAPLLKAALDRIEGSGVVVSRERMHGIPNDGAPASQAFVREVLGWR
ncbi:hypothetical protein MTES_3335 [Microbacterium testaceum StLB037]|uniref:Uncharacterized protein n=1 Tax=Microbacterium testaceum (strain StLB037) TaxID=979556 RepID=E8NE45_MICTS|nr:hypothetical protein [Microbacterium testaceum]BAJ76299.1 hypothetical protein MTES_3335 [Microbacterium testaceum StLB037]